MHIFITTQTHTILTVFIFISRRLLQQLTSTGVLVITTILLINIRGTSTQDPELITPASLLLILLRAEPVPIPGATAFMLPCRRHQPVLRISIIMQIRITQTACIFIRSQLLQQLKLSTGTLETIRIPRTMIHGICMQDPEPIMFV